MDPDSKNYSEQIKKNSTILPFGIYIFPTIWI